MQLIRSLIMMLCLCAVSQDGERELATDLPPEGVDYVIASRLDARSAEGLLRELFTQLKVRPRYRIAIFSLPGEGRPHLIFIRGKDAEVQLVKKVLTAMEDASGIAPPEDEKPFVMCLDAKEVTAGELRERLVAASGKAGIALKDKDFFIYPEGPRGNLFYIGAPGLAGRITEMSRGLDRVEPPGRVKAYFHALGGEMARAFGGLLSAVLSALALIVIHVIISHLPLVGRRYRRSFRLFWEKLFASFKGKDLAWEIIRAAAGFGVASSSVPLPREEEGRRVAGAELSRESLARRKERAGKVASEYIRWRGMDPGSPEIRSLLDAAIDAEMARD